MVDEREEWLARRFDVLHDVEVPELWEQVVGRVDTEPNVDTVGPRRRRWTLLAVAAAVLALVALGLVLWTRADPTTVDTPPGPAVGDNTVQIVEGGDEQATVTPSAVAGIVSFEISNPAGGYHGVDIRRMLPGVSFEDVRADALEFARAGGADSGRRLLEDPVLGVVNGPHDHFVTAMPLPAGEYAVFLLTTDESFASTPAEGYEVRQLTVTAGGAGAPPNPTLTFDRMAADYLIGRTNPAPRGPATIRVDNTVGGAFQLSLVELRADATQHDFELWAQASATASRLDWRTSPAATARVFYTGAAQQTITVDLDGGDLRVDARPSFDQGGLFSVVWVTVE
jgi:hypothetical protein